MKKLIELVNELETFILQSEKVAPSISKSSIGWQIEHCLLTINLITKALQQSNPALYKSKFSLAKLIIFTTKIIPRGKAKAPKIVQPQQFTQQSLLANIATVNTSINILHSLPHNQFFAHPYFGNLQLHPAIKFLEIHTQHHLKIIKDISKKA
jgi:uncharacterized ferritin-like protein (DUF455 family)